MQSSMKLYSLTGCPYCMRVKAQLKRLGLSYEEIKVPRFRGFRRQVQRLSGQNRVPVLVDGEKVIADSVVICNYLAQQYGSKTRDATAPRSVNA